MAIVELNKKVPDFSLPATSGKTLSLSDFRGKSVLIYFYPKDNTPGCTLESKDFRDHYAAFKELNIEILGVSRDSLTSHEKFKCKHAMPFELLSDTESTLCTLFDVLKPRSFFGKQIVSIQRSTFLIDEAGILKNAWRKVSARGHVAKVLAELSA